MGRTAPDFAEPLRRGLSDAVGAARWSQVAFRPVYYQGELQASQERVFRAVRAATSWDWLREFLLYGFSDAASLETRKLGPDSAYARAQRHLRDALDDAR